MKPVLGGETPRGYVLRQDATALAAENARLRKQLEETRAWLATLGLVDSPLSIEL